MHPRAHTRQFAPVQVVPVQELKGRRAAWHHTRPERPRITNPGGPNMHSPPTAHSPPQTRHSALAADVPAVAARPIYTYGTHAPRHTDCQRVAASLSALGEAAPACEGA